MLTLAAHIAITAGSLLPAAAAAQETLAPWNFTVATGLGVREVDATGYGVPWIGFWAARPTSAQRELVYEGFVHAPTTKQVGPAPLHFSPGIEREGTSTRTVADISVGALVRGNFYWGEGGVRPYVTIGGGVVLFRRVREFAETTRDLPDGVPETATRRDAEVRLGLASVAGFGIKIRTADGWHIRPEARIPVPFLPPVWGHPAASIALIVGVTYSPSGS